MTDFTLETDKELISVLNKIFAVSGGVVKNITNEQKNALYGILATQSKGNVPPPPPPLPISLPKGGRASWPVVEGVEVKAKEVKAGENAIKPPKPTWKQRNNETVNSIVQQINQGIKLKPVKTKEKDGKKEEVNTVNKKISTLSITTVQTSNLARK
ncbi:hypothetical protein [Wolbachia endosymbiont of Folsomia candida]|uniref:hypothetical protein n=1 Tax=Wolbachia endosymbiont of Folsomia candida TaxID=169402 RepID=UPI000A6097E7|nr:hypothetical protein [Wolbachia endosymbiont of Folsomia candida]APR98092.1 hypothetical protein ASM33_02125 [Wolbachia endosymbiont of Folsomia candida]